MLGLVLAERALRIELRGLLFFLRDAVRDVGERGRRVVRGAHEGPPDQLLGEPGFVVEPAEPEPVDQVPEQLLEPEQRVEVDAVDHVLVELLLERREVFALGECRLDLRRWRIDRDHDAPPAGVWPFVPGWPWAAR